MARDVELQAAGYATVRFTWRQVTEEPAWVAGRLGDLLRGANAEGQPLPRHQPVTG